MVYITIQNGILFMTKKQFAPVGPYKLIDFMLDNKLTQDQFLKLIKEKTGVTLSQGGLSKYINDQRIPRKHEMKAIFDATDGEVTPNSFYLN